MEQRKKKLLRKLGPKLAAAKGTTLWQAYRVLAYYSRFELACIAARPEFQGGLKS